MAMVEIDITDFGIEDIEEWVDNAPPWEVSRLRAYLGVSVDMDELTRWLDLHGVPGFIDYYLQYLLDKVPHIYDSRKSELEALTGI